MANNQLKKRYSLTCLLLVSFLFLLEIRLRAQEKVLFTYDHPPFIGILTDSVRAYDEGCGDYFTWAGINGKVKSLIPADSLEVEFSTQSKGECFRIYLANTDKQGGFSGNIRLNERVCICVVMESTGEILLTRYFEPHEMRKIFNSKEEIILVVPR